MLVLLVADVLFLSRIEEQVADRSDQTVNSPSNSGEENVAAGSGGVAFGLEGRVVDDQAADPTQEEGQQEANEIVVIH